MPQYQPGSEKKYFPALIAALIATALIVGSFVYNLIFVTEVPAVNKNLGIDPVSNVAFPGEEPNVKPPVSPP